MAVDFRKRTIFTLEDLRPLRQAMRLRPTVCLGLGGIGANAVSRIYDLYRNAFGAFRLEGQASAIPDCIRFLCFDSSSTECPANLARDDQWHQMRATVRDDALRDMDKDPFYKGWLPAVSDHDYTAGCAGFRGLGRLLFSRNIQLFHEKFEAAMQTATSFPRLPEQTPAVVVFSGLAGGTGSGSVLDACFYIRRQYPQAQIFGFLGLLPGVSENPLLVNNARVEVYAALKEIDAFMDEHRLKGPYRDGVTYKFPTGQVIEGVYDKPFDYCFLVTPENGRGALVLNTPAKVSSLMARTAFLLSAYSTPTNKGDRSFIGEMSDQQGVSGQPLRGTVAKYIVPGLAQAHLPLEQIADYLSCKYAAHLMSFLDSGAPFPDPDARRVYDTLGLSLSALISAVPFDAEGNAVTSKSYEDEIERLNDKDRYQPEVRSQILAWGEGLLDERRKSLTATMGAKTQALVASIGRRLQDVLAATVKAADYGIPGALDLLSDLESYIGGEIAAHQQLEKDQLGPAREITADEWNKCRPMVEDVTSKGGVFDLDSLKIPETKKVYRRFLEDNERRVLANAAADAALGVLQTVLDTVKHERTRLEELRGVVRSAQTRLKELQEVVAGDLLKREEGRGDGPAEICSFSALDHLWREGFEKARQVELNDRSVLQRLAAGNWTPLDWIAATRDSDRVAWLCEDAFRRVNEAFFWELRGFSLEQIHALRGDEILALLADLIQRLTAPQCKVDRMSDALNMAPVHFGFISGIPQRVGDLLSGKVAGYDKIRKAIAFESSSVSHLEIHYPIALAGCDAVADTFEPSYSQWRENLRRMSDRTIAETDLRKHHCFVGSADWQEPITYETGANEDEALFARCFAISVLLDPTRFPPDAPERAELARALSYVDKKSRSPKEKRFGIFKVGRSDFWLTPVFDFTKEDAAEPPVKLGGTIVAAIESLQGGGALAEAAAKFVLWVRENASTYFRDRDLEEGLDAAKSLANTLYGKQQKGSPEQKLWQAVMVAIEEWKQELL